MKIISLILAAAIMLCSFWGCSSKEKDPSNTNANASETTAKTDKDGGSPNKDEKPDADGENESEDGKDTQKNNGTSSDGGENSGKDSADAPSNGDTDSTVSNDSGNTPADSGNKDTSDKDGSKDTPASGDDTAEAPVYADGMILEAYISILAGQFYSEYDAKDGAPKKDLLHMTVLFLYSQRSSLVEVSSDKSRITISANLMEKTMQLLFGEGLKLSDYTSYLDSSKGDSYDSATDAYSFSAYRENWGEGSYALSMEDAMEYFENGNTTVLTVTLVNEKGKERIVSYELEKVVYDNYLYFRLEKVYVS